MNDARGLAVTSGSAECVAALDRTAESYLGFRADMGAQVNAAVEADPGAPLPQVMKGYLGMLLSNANALGMVDDCLIAARAAAQGSEREQLHLRALGAWRAARNTDAIAAWEAILARHYKNVHTDVTRLIELGLIERRNDQRVVVMWDIVAAEMRLAA